MNVACLLTGGDYKPGDPAPDGYVQWHEWAEVQYKSGLRQKACPTCGLWRFPQEFSSESVEWESFYIDRKTAKKQVVQQSEHKCLKCATGEAK